MKTIKTLLPSSSPTRPWQPGDIRQVSDETAARKVARGEAEYVDVEDDDPGDGLDEKTVDELKDLAKQAELPTSGSKAELVERLREHGAQVETRG